LKDLLRQVGWRAGDIQGVAVTTGPGSFTGLRVGVTTAKALAYAVKADVAGVDTLEAVAAACPVEFDRLSVAVDAQRGQVVFGVFRRGADGWFSPSGPWQLADLDAWLAHLPAGIAVAGPVLRGLSHELPKGVRVLDPRYWSPTAAAIGRLAARRFARGERDDLWALAPRYYRRSAAEERWERKQQQSMEG
jgi:tRNA threonylcarbamoyladenosine biosynthesis protein TsaB